GGQPTDQCERDEVLMEDGTCQNLLTPGNCNAQEEEVLIDAQTNRGFCARRICPPDRVFISATQLCHDPRDSSVCPPGRELYYSAFGTAVCMCPDGTIEGDDDLDDDVCEPVLGKSLQCLPGQVFWLKDFNSPPQCLPDPCNGANLNRATDTLPFIPNKFGKCFQLGQTQGACPYGQIYILNLEQVRGECTTLQDAGYNIFDEQTLYALMRMFGPSIARTTTQSFGNTTQTGSGMYGTSPSVNGINTNTIQPISSYQTHTNNKVIPVKTTPNNFHTASFQQPNNNIDIGQTNQIQQTHHQIVIGPNGFTSSKKTKPFSPPQQYPTSQHQPLNIKIQSFNQNTIPNTQKPFSSQSPINHINSPISFNQHSRPTINPTINDVTPNINPLISHGNQGGISNHQSRPSPGVNANQGKEICTFVQNPNGQGGKKVCQQIHSGPSSGANANKGKEICTFVQNPNGQGGKKVCQTIQPGPFNSHESQGQGGQFNSPEIFGHQQPLSFESVHGRGRARDFETYGYRLGKSFGFRNVPQPGLLTHHVTVLPNGEIVTHLRPVSRHGRSAANEQAKRNESANKVLSRKRRNILPYASPTNVFETRLININLSTLIRILFYELLASNFISNDTTITIKSIFHIVGEQRGLYLVLLPMCIVHRNKNGMAFNIRRMCVPSTSAQNSLIALNLG
ncbi:hypothetical protein Anas_07785, partial [Armadillidium nasatum]